MKITDKVSNERLAAMFAASTAALDSTDPAGTHVAPPVVEQASIYSELLSARQALVLNPSFRIADALERIAKRFDDAVGDDCPIHVHVDYIPGPSR